VLEVDGAATLEHQIVLDEINNNGLSLLFPVSSGTEHNAAISEPKPKQVRLL